jgi:hypothetical protein
MEERNMEPLNDGIHNCKECEIYKKYGVTCSSQPELHIDSCKYCDTRMCCRSPALVLMRCERNTILDKIDEGEYIECAGIIPFNIETRYCKHIDIKTMDCKVYNQRPIACRIAGHSCLGDFWIKAIKEQHDKNKNEKKDDNK